VTCLLLLWTAHLLTRRAEARALFTTPAMLAMCVRMSDGEQCGFPDNKLTKAAKLKPLLRISNGHSSIGPAVFSRKLKSAVSRAVCPLLL